LAFGFYHSKNPAGGPEGFAFGFGGATSISFLNSSMSFLSSFFFFFAALLSSYFVLTYLAADSLTLLSFYGFKSLKKVPTTASPNLPLINPSDSSMASLTALSE